MSSPDASMLRFDGRVALVTGAGSGLGEAHAGLLARRGASVVVNDLPAPTAPGGAAPDGPAAKVVRAIEQAGGDAYAIEADVSIEHEAEALVAAVLDRFGRIDIVVNNAGLLRASDFADQSMATFDRVMAVNLRAVVCVTRAAWPAMQRAGYGRVVSTTSNSGLLGTAGSTAYAAAKAGLWGVTKSLALEGADAGIHVNAVAPIAFTPMSASSRIAPESWRTGEGDAWARRLDVAHVSPVVAWLAHEDCMQSGRILSVAGGRVARFEMGLSSGYVEEKLEPEIVRDNEATLFADSELELLGAASEEGRALHRRLRAEGRIT